MAIRRDIKPEETIRGYRERLHAFMDNESGIKALQGYINPDNSMSHGGMYILEIINNLIQSNNGTEKLYQRLPPEVFRGMPEGGRRILEASLIGRAAAGADAPEQGILESGYTRVQEIIGKWSEKDGSWHDTPDADLVKKGYIHQKNYDGSEAHIFLAKDKSKSGYIYKTIDCSHYSNFELMLDRIAIHNATFPDTAMYVEGFGIRDEALTNTDFVVVVRQPFVQGRKPTMTEIEESMETRGYNKSNNGFFFVSALDNTAITDIHDENAVMTEKGHVLVFDCEAFLKYFPTETIIPERYSLRELLPNERTGRLDSPAWRKILGDQYASATEEEKSRIIKELRLTGTLKGTINGNMVTMDHPIGENVNIGGKTVHCYRGDVLVGHPDAFKKEKIYTIPDMRYSDESVSSIRNTVNELVPKSIDLEEFLFSEKYVGQKTVQYRGGGVDRQYYKDCLKEYGHIPELVNDKYIVQNDPSHPGRVLVSTKEKVAFMLWPNNSPVEGVGKLTVAQKKSLAEGKPIIVDGTKYQFDLDKGRVAPVSVQQIKLAQRQKQGKRNAPAL